MEAKLTIPSFFGWAFGTLVFIIGVLNLFLVHPVPGIAYLLLSLVYWPPVNAHLKRRFNFSIPAALKILLGIVLLLFTLGVSDLGDMMDKL
ncbi:hypothetical protein ACD591_03970 [Rufibacter glacialis]|uniref:Uncharacterized protein n=1 Tax=Rufibacter glacialis TaxID=1259555 RepID=A0A5M8QET7_9BACT|nr:hypothetical protein [Rufibacter glacialis]KAA6434519.1 hypothetical protein FOE74_10045 [Rufibacter glacialis]GGK70311.1 hypothetical protein GCM10011405_17990 [Rufibacter glacialis]